MTPRTVFHIGPPKTASTALQVNVIPYLGRPYQIRPQWAKDLARDPDFSTKPELEPGTIVSQELLGDFFMFPPAVIAKRLQEVDLDAIVVLVERDPVDLFRSFYRQALISEVFGGRFGPTHHGVAFDKLLNQFKKFGRGLFASIWAREVLAEYFTVVSVPFALLNVEFQCFARSFARACEVDKYSFIDGPPVNQSSAETFDALTAKAGRSDLGPFRDAYIGPVDLSPDRLEVLRAFAYAKRFD